MINGEWVTLNSQLPEDPDRISHLLQWSTHLLPRPAAGGAPRQEPALRLRRARGLDALCEAPQSDSGRDRAGQTGDLCTCRRTGRCGAG
jgi:hypothetical protein